MIQAANLRRDIELPAKVRSLMPRAILAITLHKTSLPKICFRSHDSPASKVTRLDGGSTNPSVAMC